jgi:hypothetical protein
MINKKILAVAVASAFSVNTYAAVDLDAAGTTADPYGTAVFASEAIESTDLTDGLLEAVNNTNILDFSASVGFTIGNGTSKYVRVELDNGAKFDAVPSLTSANTSASVAQGGDEAAFVIFEVAATAAIPADQAYTVASANYLLNASGTTSVTVSTYETAADAVNEVNVLYSDTAPLSSVTSIVTGEIADASFSTATVASDFKAFEFGAGADGDAVSAVLGNLGALDVTGYVDGTAYNPAGVAVTAATLLEATQNVTVTGDFSFGAWTLDLTAACDGVSDIDLTVNADEDAATSASAVTVATKQYLCVTVDGTEVINKGSYSLELVDDEVSDVVGKIVYDTTSIEVPYLTTFSDYNQRLYITNYGSIDAAYTISFTSEDGVEAVAGDKATGIVPKGEMIAIKATDIVTLTGRTRTAATLEVEAEDENVSATTQTVNVADKSTDTVVLN